MHKRLSMACLLIMLCNHSLLKAQNAYELDIPLAAGIILNKAEELAKAGEIDQAIKVITTFQSRRYQAVPENSKKKGYNHAILDYALGNYEMRQSHLQKAIFHYTTSLKKNAYLSSAWLNLGKCYYDSNQMKKAGPAFLKGYEKSDPKEAKYLYYSAVCYVGENNFKQSHRLFKQLFESHPHDILLIWKEAYVHTLIALEKDREAIPFMEVLARELKPPKKKRWQERLLFHYLSLNMKKKALAYAIELTKDHVTEKKWWRALAHIHLNEGRYREGLVALLAYNFLSPLTDDEIRLMGDVYMMLEIPSEAVFYYKDLLDKKMSTGSLEKMVRAQLRQYDHAAAIEWIDKGILNQSHLLLKGKILFEIRRFKEAATIFEQLSEMDRENGEVFLMLGYTYWNLSNIDKAISAFHMSAKYEKQRKAAHQALKRLK